MQIFQKMLNNNNRYYCICAVINNKVDIIFCNLLSSGGVYNFNLKLRLGPAIVEEHYEKVWKKKKRIEITFNSMTERSLRIDWNSYKKLWML